MGERFALHVSQDARSAALKRNATRRIRRYKQLYVVLGS
jgi:hypothetical protein